MVRGPNGVDLGGWSVRRQLSVSSCPFGRRRLSDSLLFVRRCMMASFLSTTLPMRSSHGCRRRRPSLKNYGILQKTCPFHLLKNLFGPVGGPFEQAGDDFGGERGPRAFDVAKRKRRSWACTAPCDVQCRERQWEGRIFFPARRLRLPCGKSLVPYVRAY